MKKRFMRYSKFNLHAVTEITEVLDEFKYSKVRWRINAVLFKRLLVNSIPVRGRQRIACLDDASGIVHYSFLLPSCSKFPFMKKGDCMLGPCWTRVDQRGKGIYPEMLRRLAAEHLVINPESNVYVLARPENTASIKGILKAGFVQIGYAYKTKLLKKYYLSKALKIEVLVAAMNQINYSIIENMKITTDAIVGNQCDRNEAGHIEIGGHNIAYLSYCEKRGWTQ